MAVTRQKKERILETLEGHLRTAKSVAFVETTKITVLEVSDMRTEYRKQHAVFMLAKKTLIALAFKNVLGVEIPASALVGQTGLVIGKGDGIAPLAITARFANDFRKEQKIRFSGGFFEGRLLSDSEVSRLASLPSREVLLAKLMGSMKSPVSGLARFFDGAKRELESKGGKTVRDLATVTE